MIERMLTETFIVGLLAGMVRMAAPIIAASAGEILAERSGVLNLGLEGIMLTGAFAGYVGAAFSGNLWVGVLCSLIAGGLLAGVHAFISITLRGDQIISGLAISILCGGLVLFFFRVLFGLTQSFPRVGFQPVDLPVLSSIRFIGPIFFQQNILVYLIFFCAVFCTYLLYRTSFGLKVRGVGENPGAADAMGVSVKTIRYLCVILGGMLTGLGGSFMTLGHLHLYVNDITSGRGWIAIALVIFGRWDPMKALGGALLFGFVDAFQFRIQGLGVKIPVHLLFMLPYLLTIVVLLSVARRAEMPAALGSPYRRE